MTTMARNPNWTPFFFVSSKTDMDNSQIQWNTAGGSIAHHSDLKYKDTVKLCHVLGRLATDGASRPWIREGREVKEEKEGDTYLRTSTVAPGTVGYGCATLEGAGGGRRPSSSPRWKKEATTAGTTTMAASCDQQEAVRSELSAGAWRSSRATVSTETLAGE